MVDRLLSFGWQSTSVDNFDTAQKRRNIAHALRRLPLAGARCVMQGRGFGTFNPGRGEPGVVRRLIEMLADAPGMDPQVVLKEGVRRWVEWIDRSEEAPEELRGRR